MVKGVRSISLERRWAVARESEHYSVGIQRLQCSAALFRNDSIGRHFYFFHVYLGLLRYAYQYNPTAQVVVHILPMLVLDPAATTDDCVSEDIEDC